MSFFSRLQPDSPWKIPRAPGWESPLLIVQTQFLCDGAVRTKNCVWTSVAEVSPPPAGLQDGSRGTGQRTDLPRARGTAGNRSRGQDFRQTKETPAAAPLCSARPRVLGVTASNPGRIIPGTAAPTGQAGTEGPSLGHRRLAGSLGPQTGAAGGHFGPAAPSRFILLSFIYFSILTLRFNFI